MKIPKGYQYTQYTLTRSHTSNIQYDIPTYRTTP